ncbi:hypothetical protein [Mycoplasma sp. CSL7503-lung]|uniref:hypothetical protein n=1 Tax=Mycoplasma sp. CSL7503-lung TaxID=536372 RepID=UPI0021D141AC|nr:hypothetical protein [Mycoplasma sp. CSL7503-lung]MCU4706294.1 hypothetical protein [Mycoplasma sp. CSL7503-lung]
MNKKIKTILLSGLTIIPLTTLAISCSNNSKFQNEEEYFINVLINIQYKNSWKIDFDNLTNNNIENIENYLVSAPDGYELILISASKQEQGIDITYKLKYKNITSNDLKTFISKNYFKNNEALPSKQSIDFDQLKEQITFEFHDLNNLKNTIDFQKININTISYLGIEEFKINLVDAYVLNNEVVINYNINNDDVASDLFTYKIDLSYNQQDEDKEDNNKLLKQFDNEYKKVKITYQNNDFLDFNNLNIDQIQGDYNYLFKGTDFEYKFIEAKKDLENKTLKVKFKFLSNSVESQVYEKNVINDFSTPNFSYLNKNIIIKYKNSEQTYFDQIEKDENNIIPPDKITFNYNNPNFNIEIIKATKKQNAEKIEVSYKIRYKNYLSQVFVDYINKYDFKLREKELKELEETISVDFNNPANYTWSQIQENIDSNTQNNQLIENEIKIKYINNNKIPNLISLRHDDKNIIINLSIKNQNENYEFQKLISKDIFIQRPQEPISAKVINDSITTYSTALRFSEIFNENLTIKIDEDDNEAKQQGIKPGIYKLKLNKDQIKEIYKKEDLNSKNIQDGKAQIIYGELTGYYDNDTFEKLRYELKINFKNLPINDLKWTPSNLDQFNLLENESNTYKHLNSENNIDSQPISTLLKNTNDRWDNWFLHNNDQSEEKNYLTLQVNNNQEKTFYRVDVSFWPGATIIDSKLILPEQFLIKYSNDGETWFNAKNQSKLSFKDFGKYKIYTSSKNSNHGDQEYFETYDVPRNDNGYYRTEINFVPFRSKYIKIEWIPQKNLSTKINNEIQHSMIGMRKLHIEYTDDDLKDYSNVIEKNYESDPKINLLNKIKETKLFLNNISEKIKAEQVSNEIKKAEELFYSDYDSEIYESKIIELNNLINQK